MTVPYHAQSREDRMLGAIMGQFVGDALSLGTHWHYDLAKRAKIYPHGIQGFEQPIDGHYHQNRQPGAFTHYGDAGLVVLKSVAECGRFDHKDYGKRFVALFGDPDYPGYVDKAAKGTIANAQGAEPGFDWQHGADDMQTGTMSRLAPIIVRHIGDADMDRIVETATRVCQQNDEAVACTIAHGQILRAVIDGVDLIEAIEAVAASAGGTWGDKIRGHLDEARKLADQSVTDATGAFGRACYLKSTFPSCLHAALEHGRDARACLLETVRAGGDNASRTSVVGAWMGAAHGCSGLPAAWLDRLAARDAVLDLAKRVVASACD